MPEVRSSTIALNGNLTEKEKTTSYNRLSYLVDPIIFICDTTPFRGMNLFYEDSYIPSVNRLSFTQYLSWFKKNKDSEILTYNNSCLLNKIQSIVKKTTAIYPVTHTNISVVISLQQRQFIKLKLLEPMLVGQKSLQQYQQYLCSTYNPTPWSGALSATCLKFTGTLMISTYLLQK